MTESTGSRPHILELEQLRAALNGLIDLAIDRFGPTLDVDQFPQYNDYYWHLPRDTAHAMDADPGLHVDAGQSSDDLEELAKMLTEPQDQVLWHSAEHLVGLLRLIAFLDAPRTGHGLSGRTSSLPVIADPKSGPHSL